MAFSVSERSSRRFPRVLGLFALPALAVGLVAACSDTGTSGGLGSAGGAGGGSGGASSGGGGTSSTAAGTSTVMGGTGPSTGGGGMTSVAGVGGVSGGSGGTGGASGGAGSGGGGSGGTDGAGTAGTGGTAPTCTVPVSGGVDFSKLLVGRVTAEGETAQLAGAAAVASEGSGWTGTGFADMKGSEGSMTWLIDVPAAGDYVLDWRYTQQDTRDMSLSVNCVKTADSVAFTNTDSWNTNWVTGGAQKVTLKKGTNQILLETNGGSGPNFDTLVVSPPICPLVSDMETTCEAERALLSGAAGVAAQGSGWKDLGFADMLGAEGGVNWVVDAPHAGTYTLTFVYTQDDTRDMTLTVNGVVALASLPFNDTNSWNTAWAADVSYDVSLKQGLNSLQLATNGASGPNFDSVKIDDLGAGGAGAGGASEAGGAP